MRRFVLGVIEGIGIGLVLGWSLGVSGLVPSGGYSNWAMSIISILLIFVGATGLRPRSGNLGQSSH